MAKKGTKAKTNSSSSTAGCSHSLARYLKEISRPVLQKKKADQADAVEDAKLEARRGGSQKVIQAPAMPNHMSVKKHTNYWQEAIDQMATENGFCC